MILDRRVNNGAIKIIRGALKVSFIISLVLLIFGKVQTIIAWWGMSFCLLPAVVLVQSSQYLSLKSLVWTILITQSVSLPVHYLIPDGYMQQEYRPFYFTGWESFLVLYKIGIFLCLVILFTNIIELFYKICSRGLGDSLSSKNNNALQLLNKSTLPSINTKRRTISPLILIAIIILAIPLNMWMFKMGIGLTGVTPPKLPFKLSGILTYFAKYIIPCALLVLYFRTSHKSFVLVILLGLYSLFLGVSTVSRAAGLLIIIAPLILSYKNRQWIMFLFSSAFTMINYATITLSRSFVYAFSGGFINADTSLGILSTLKEAASRIELNSIFFFIPELTSRLESFSGLWLSSKVDPDVLGGGMHIWFKSLYWGLVEIDNDAIHLEVLGYTVPEGFYNVSAGLLHYLLWALGESNLFYFLFAFSTAFIFVSVERAIRVIQYRYYIKEKLVIVTITVFTILFFAGPGSIIIVLVYIFIILVSILPKLSFLFQCFKKIGICNVTINLKS
jgi:hypothetical protein